MLENIAWFVWYLFVIISSALGFYLCIIEKVYSIIDILAKIPLLMLCFIGFLAASAGICDIFF